MGTRRKKRKNGLIFLVLSLLIIVGIAAGVNKFLLNDNIKAAGNSLSDNQQTKAADKDTNVVNNNASTSDSNNKAGNNATAEPIKDTEPPKIIGTHDQTVYIGDTVSYKKDVTVTDNVDKNVKLEVDSSAVNLKKTGTYTVIYKATDSSGNTATKKAAFKVMEKPKETTADASNNQQKMDVLADKVLATIIKDDMSNMEKVKAIYRWTKSNISYVDHSDKSDWVKGAIQGLSTKSGDCFTYFSTAKELLTRAGIQNKDIVKIDGHHYWNLVNLGSGWYHFDTTPRKGDKVFYSLFMLTDAQIQAYSKTHGNSHIWDKTKYPATPEKIVNN